MNTNNVVSHIVAADLSGKEGFVVQLTSTGINLGTALTKNVGVLVRGNVKKESGSAVGLACDIMLMRGTIAYAKISTTGAAIAMGAGLILDVANPGYLTASETAPIAIAWQAMASQAAIGSVIQVYFL